MKKRKIVAILLVLSMMLGASSCSQDTSSSRRNKRNKSKKERVKETEESENPFLTETVAQTSAATEATIPVETTAMTMKFPSSSFFTVHTGSDYKAVEFYSDANFTSVSNGYSANAEGIYFQFQTQKFYGTDAKFYVDVKIDDELVIDNLEGTMRDPVGSDWGDVSLNGPIPAGKYEIIITGFDGYILATAYFTVQ